MPKIAVSRIIFDRKRVATKGRVGLVQLEVLYERKRKYFSTGVKVYKDQWSERSHVTNRPDMLTLNAQINNLKELVDGFIISLAKEGEPFSFDALERWFTSENEKRTSFPSWMERRIEERTDITEGTKATHRVFLNLLYKYGRIIGFNELTTPNILTFDDWLHKNDYRQSSIKSFHNILSSYIRDAMRRELVDKNPYAAISIECGKTDWGKFLSEEEVATLENISLPEGNMAETRDLFLLQCYTGLAFSDLMAADFKSAQLVNGVHILRAERVKSGIVYTTVLLPKTVRILEQYNYDIPKMHISTYDCRLKRLAQICGIPKPIASHYGRRTCGMILLNEGFPIEIVARVLGHANIKTTQEAYARILDKTVAAEFAKRQK